MGCSGSTEAAGQSAAAPAQPSASATPVSLLMIIPKVLNELSDSIQFANLLSYCELIVFPCFPLPATFWSL